MVKKGQNIVDMNNAAIDQGVGALVKVDVPADWKTLLMKVVTKLNQAVNPAHLSFKTLHNQSMHKLVMIFLYPHSLVTKMVHYLLVLLNTKNAVLQLFVPKWLPENCIQCNQMFLRMSTCYNSSNHGN